MDAYIASLHCSPQVSAPLMSYLAIICETVQRVTVCTVTCCSQAPHVGGVRCDGLAYLGIHPVRSAHLQWGKGASGVRRSNSCNKTTKQRIRTDNNAPDLHLPWMSAEPQRHGIQPVAATGKGGDASRQSLESLRSENEALRNSISEAEAAVGQLSSGGGGGGGSAVGGPNSPEAVLGSAENGAAANGNKTSATAASPPSAPSAERPAGMPSTSNEHAGGGPWLVERLQNTPLRD